MSSRKKKRVESRDVTRLKYFDQLAPLLERLHEVGTQRNNAGNQQLFMDQFCMLVLLFLFNPIVDSLRGVQQASELRRVQKKLGCPRTSLGSLSEATDVFDPKRLQADFVGMLARECPAGSRMRTHLRWVLVVAGRLHRMSAGPARSVH